MKIVPVTLTTKEARALAKDPKYATRIAEALLGPDDETAPSAAPRKGKKKGATAAPKARKSSAPKGDAVEQAASTLARLQLAVPYSAEQLRTLTGLDAAALSRVTKLLLSEKKLVQSGAKRGTRYMLAPATE